MRDKENAAKRPLRADWVVIQFQQIVLVVDHHPVRS
jgi:hypothetical protein